MDEVYFVLEVKCPSAQAVCNETYTGHMPNEVSALYDVSGVGEGGRVGTFFTLQFFTFFLYSLS
jgi:hypothetical protein